MEIHILTLFPKMFNGPLSESILGRAVTSNLISIDVHNIRDFSLDPHKVVDDVPFGGGPGMLLKPEPIFSAVDSILSHLRSSKFTDETDIPVILLSPQGRPFSQEIAAELARHESLILICGRYEGIDSRVEEKLATDSLSIGDYILTGGELPAMVVVDAISRRIPGVLGDKTSGESDSFSSGLLQAPEYTRPSSFRGWDVPSILRSGNHQEIALWKRRMAIKQTWERRPDLIDESKLTNSDLEFLSNLRIDSHDRDQEA